MSTQMPLLQELLFIVINLALVLHSSNVSTSEEVHADVAGIALQRVHANGIELPVLSTSDKVSVA